MTLEFDEIRRLLPQKWPMLMVDRVLELDGRQRSLAAERDDLRNRIKTLSKQVGALHKEGKADEAVQVQAESRSLGEREQELATEATEPVLISISRPTAVQYPS